MCKQFLITFFFLNNTATTEIYTLSLHDALPISSGTALTGIYFPTSRRGPAPTHQAGWVEANGEGPEAELLARARTRSEEHTSELQSQSNLVCRLLLEKKNSKNHTFLIPSTPAPH